MKRILLVLALFVFTAGIVSAQNAVIEVEGDIVYDFGDIKESGGPVTHTFIVKNTGDAALVITNVTSSCGCTIPDSTKEPIAPGKTGEVKVTFDPKGRPGPLTKPVSVYSNGKTGSFILTIKGNVIQG